jgi:HlyD family secretion protein
MKRVIPVIVVIAVGLAILIFYTIRRDMETPGQLLISGNIEATEVEVGFRVMGQIESLPVEEGDAVKAGDEIASLSTELYEAQAAGAGAQAAAARAVLKALREGARVQEISQAEAALEAAEAQYEKIAIDYERAQKLFKTETIPEEQLQAAAAAYKAARAQVQSARAVYDLVKEGPRAEEIEAAEARLNAAEQQLRLANEQLDYCRLTSPIDGVVLSLSAEMGEVTLPGSVVASIADLKNVWLRGYVGETELGKIRLGQAVDVTVDSLPGKIFPGRLSFISSESEFTPKQVQTRKERVKLVYRVKIALNNSSGELKIGMPADAMIKTQ